MIDLLSHQPSYSLANYVVLGVALSREMVLLLSFLAGIESKTSKLAIPVVAPSSSSSLSADLLLLLLSNLPWPYKCGARKFEPQTRTITTFRSLLWCKNAREIVHRSQNWQRKTKYNNEVVRSKFKNIIQNFYEQEGWLCYVPDGCATFLFPSA